MGSDTDTRKIKGYPTEQIIEFGWELGGMTVWREKCGDIFKYRCNIYDYSAGEMLDEPENNVDRWTEEASSLEQALDSTGDWWTVSIVRVAPEVEEELKRIGMSHSGFVQRMENYESAKEADKRRAERYLKESGECIETGNFQDALGLTIKALEYDPSSAKAYFDKGSIHFIRDDFQHAIEDFSHAIDLDPTNWQSFLNRGEAYIAIGEFELAVADQSEAMKLVPKEYVR